MMIWGYAAVLTSILTGMISFDCIWHLTNMPVFHALAWSLFLAMAVGICFAIIADLLVGEREDGMLPEEKSDFVTDATGLSYLPQRSRRTR